MDQFAATVLILLHAPGGNLIHVNPAAVTSMHASVPGKPNEMVTNDARCMVGLSDGKFVSVVETCDRVRELIAGTEPSKRGD